MGHSTSGSHERYKPVQRLEWEREQDCIVAFSEWIEAVGIASSAELEEIRHKGVAYARQCKKEAWEAKTMQVKLKRAELLDLLHNSGTNGEVTDYIERTNKLIDPELSDLQAIARQTIYHQLGMGVVSHELKAWSAGLNRHFRETYSTHFLRRWCEEH